MIQNNQMIEDDQELPFNETIDQNQTSSQSILTENRTNYITSSRYNIIRQEYNKWHDPANAQTRQSLTSMQEMRKSTVIIFFKHEMLE